MIEIRWHGRGGQGAVTASKMLAAAALRMGKYFQAFPEYGPERRGAPVQAFTRISDTPIGMFSQVTNPAIVVVVDPSLIGKAPITAGMDDKGILIANYEGSPAELRQKMGFTGGKVYTINATEVAMRILGRPITNTPMLGALIKITGVVSMDHLAQEVTGMFAKLSADMVQKNLAAVQAGYEEVLGE